MSTQTLPTIADLQNAIAQTEAEIGTLQQRLTELGTYPPAPGLQATHEARINYRVQLSKLRNDRAPEVEGVREAIAELQADLQRDRVALAQLQAEEGKAGRESRIAAARVEIEALGQVLADRVAAVEATLTEIHEAIAAVEGDHQALQANPWPPSTEHDDRHSRWRPNPFVQSQYPLDALPVLVAHGEGYGTCSAAMWEGAKQVEAQRIAQAQRLQQTLTA